MDLSPLTTVWCPLPAPANLVIVTDQHQASLAARLAADNKPALGRFKLLNLDLLCLQTLAELPPLGPDDLLVILLSVPGYLRGANRLFPAFQKPKGLAANYVMIRPGIDEASLASGLHTPPAQISALEANLKTNAANRTIRLTAPGGTDLTLRTRGFTALPYRFTETQDYAYLPAAEIYTAIEEESANGLIVVDLTVGELRLRADLLQPFGLVREPLTIKVKNGSIEQFSGGLFAGLLTEEFSKLNRNCQCVVELGYGLSVMQPTGLIGIDESILGTCHFGIGDNLFYGGCNQAPIHWDVVIRNPSFQVSSE
ncbi:MAG: hypothetical protein LLG09_05695 [Negativicutes bacterium]|nr:hypothetical protein [Negativicutes bacterium]